MSGQPHPSELRVRNDMIRLEPLLGFLPHVFDLVMVFVFDYEMALSQAIRAGNVEEVKELLGMKKGIDDMGMETGIELVIGDGLIVASGSGHAAVVALLMQTTFDGIQSKSDTIQTAKQNAQAYAGKVFGRTGAFHAAMMAHAGPQFQVMGTILLKFSNFATSLQSHAPGEVELPFGLIPETEWTWLSEVPVERGWYLHPLTCWPRLHIASFFRLPQLTRELLEAGADPQEKCIHGYDPLALASDTLSNNPRFNKYYRPPACPELNRLLEDHLWFASHLQHQG